MFASKSQMAEVPLTGTGACSVSNTTVNWASKLTTPIKDQGYCGSCWSFAAAEQLESDIMRVYGKNYTYELSEEQLLDCNTAYPQSGCDGGVVYYAFQYLQSHYIEKNSSYAYSSYYNTNTKSCKYDSSKGVGGVKTIYAVTQDESCMASYVQQNGPIYVGVNADAWSAYSGGVMSAAACGYGVINHAVQIVGVSIPGKYWILRNTWGNGWGENGYIRLQYGKNACNMTEENALFVTPFVGTTANAASATVMGGLTITMLMMASLSIILAMM